MTKNPWQQLVKSVTQPWSTKANTPPAVMVEMIDPSSYPNPVSQQGGAWFWPGNNVEKFFSFSNLGSATKAYQSCPPVTAIINRKAQCFANGKMFVVNRKGKEAQTEVAKRLRKLFTRPNPLQTWKQFDAQNYIFQQVFGFCPVLAIKPIGFTENYYATSLWNIPPTMVKIKETGAIFYQTDLKGMIESITLTYKKTETKLNVNDVLIMRDFTPSFESLVIPDSRLKSMAMLVNNILGALESRNVLINYRGALGILSPEKDQFGVAPINPDDKDELQRDFMRSGLTSQQWKFIISSAALKWQPMGIAPKELMLIEEVAECTKSLCDGFNYPPHLMGLIDPSFNNQNTAEKGLYQNAIIPESDSNMEQWNDFFQTEEYGLEIQKDFSHLPVLQANKLEEAQTRFQLNQAKKMEFEAGLITLDQWLVALGEDPLPNNTGQVRASDLSNSNVPLAVTLGVGGTQGLISVVTSSMGPEAKQATLEILFGLAPADAARMATQGPKPEPPNPPPGTPPDPNATPDNTTA